MINRNDNGNSATPPRRATLELIHGEKAFLPSDHRRCLAIVPGLHFTLADHQDLADRLAPAYDAVMVLDVPWEMPPHQVAEDLKKALYVNDVRGPLDCLGYGSGGLAARCYVEDLNANFHARVENVFLLNTPNTGTTAEHHVDLLQDIQQTCTLFNIRQIHSTSQKEISRWKGDHVDQVRRPEKDVIGEHGMSHLFEGLEKSNLCRYWNLYYVADARRASHFTLGKLVSDTHKGVMNLRIGSNGFNWEKWARTSSDWLAAFVQQTVDGDLPETMRINPSSRLVHLPGRDGGCASMRQSGRLEPVEDLDAELGATNYKLCLPCAKAAPAPDPVRSEASVAS